MAVMQAMYYIAYYVLKQVIGRTTFWTLLKLIGHDIYVTCS
jgi:hypothetical protein